MRHLALFQNTRRHPVGGLASYRIPLKDSSSLRFCNFPGNFWNGDVRIRDAVSEIKFNPLKSKVMKTANVTFFVALIRKNALQYVL